jgi:hypothetical protein
MGVTTGRKSQLVTEGGKDREKRGVEWKYSQKCRMFKEKAGKNKERLAESSEGLLPFDQYNR